MRCRDWKRKGTPCPQYFGQHVSLSPDSRIAAVIDMNNKSINLWDLAKQELILQIPDVEARSVHEPQLEFSPDGQTIWLVNNRTSLSSWKAQTGKKNGTVQLEKIDNDSQSMEGLIVSSDARLAAIIEYPLGRPPGPGTRWSTSRCGTFRAANWCTHVLSTPGVGPHPGCRIPSRC